MLGSVNANSPLRNQLLIGEPDSVRDNGRDQTQWDYVSVWQLVVFHGAGGQTLECGEPEWVDDGCEALLVGFEEHLRRLPFVVDSVDMGAVLEQLADHVRRTRIQLRTEVQLSQT